YRPRPAVPVQVSYGIQKATAANAAPKAMTKGALEMPVLRSLSMPPDSIDDAEWRQIAARAGERVAFQPATLALIREKAPNFTPKMLDHLKQTVAQDTVRNELDFHLRIHDWFSKGQVTTFEKLNQRVYAELFLTPKSDPWLGLVADDAFSAIEGGGVVV